ncbi:nucleoside/nucleotide kinase family protein [Mycobacterium sp. EPa45]|uniref:nucleoside/nucleotide kinase family protein n=1 Tax=Mycobacterium sp. EPa45 TaxID=1545728 RepID=UPI0009E2CD50|nr:nucleoside/nucleotide kinase family protein [Mycobacterium sp. EPa45]
MDRVVSETVAVLDAAPSRVLVGITGPPGAGKSTLAQAVVSRIQGASYLPMDGFHLSNTVLARLGRCDRKGAADTFDAAGYVSVLHRVRSDYRLRDVYVPDFDRRLDEPVAAGHVIAADCRLVITEGNYLGVPDGEWSGVRGLLDRLFYVDCPADVRWERLVARHIAGGRTRAAAEAWVDEVDEPDATLIATTRQWCDAVIDGC